MDNNADEQERNQAIAHQFEEWQRTYYDDVYRYWKEQNQQRLISAFTSWENRFRKYLKDNFFDLYVSYDNQTNPEYTLDFYENTIESFKERKSDKVEAFLTQCIEDAKKGYVALSYVGADIEKEKNSKESFPEELATILGKDFSTEIKDLRHNFGVSGTCTAFLLRKILEKLIYLAFAKNGQIEQLKDKNGRVVGLDAMLNLATSNKVNGTPFLTPKTVEEIRGSKFLGDTAAHNPMANVLLPTIIREIPYIILAYGELAKKV